MSLLCDETDLDIEYGDTLRASTRAGARIAYALDGKVVERIPKSERRLKPCRPGDGGLDIHEGTSSRNFNGSYSLFGFKIGKFLFSVSKKTAEKYLPNNLRHMNGR